MNIMSGGNEICKFSFLSFSTLVVFFIYFLFLSISADFNQGNLTCYHGLTNRMSQVVKIGKVNCLSGQRLKV